MDEASLLLERFQALGSRAVLFISRPGIKTWTNEVLLPRCEVTEAASACLKRMEALFEFVVQGWIQSGIAAAEIPQPTVDNSLATSDSVDARQGDQHILQRSIEHMCLGVYQKKASLYNQTDSNKIRQLRRRKLGDEKRKLFEAIKQYNEQVPEEEGINEEMVESRLSVVGHASGEEILIWPWEVHSTESTNILTKKKIFDAYMSKMRLQEEKILILREMRQHCTYHLPL
ncbi:uncharacterized protein LOC127158372, partial [Labeo rohita]|uniref:uncharacterized protein LOC127158372 n=1 Tax=Labeo rohita TaxID=84645 RepID=UPI0021E2579B